MGACFSCKIIKLSLASPEENKNQRIATVLVTSEESEVACIGKKKKNCLERFMYLRMLMGWSVLARMRIR